MNADKAMVAATSPFQLTTTTAWWPKCPSRPQEAKFLWFRWRVYGSHLLTDFYVYESATFHDYKVSYKCKECETHWSLWMNRAEVIGMGLDPDERGTR